MIPRTMTSNEVYVLPLKDNGAPDVPGEYIYLAPRSNEPITVRFTIEGTSSICRQGSLWVNIPERGSEFRRDEFREYRLNPDFNRTIEISIPVYEAGAFAFYTTYAELPHLSSTLNPHPSAQAGPQKTPLYYIDVAPRLSLEGRPLPLAALSIFSVISKFMGKYPSDWEKHLRGIGGRGYNMIHFTPLQVRGASNSPYSLYDQLGWDPECFPRGEDDVRQMVDSLEHTHSLLSLTDIVLNHTANNSKWLLEHPEAGYNLTTAPWLESAYVLDTQLLVFGSKLEDLGYPKELRSTDDLIKIMDGIKKHVISEIRLWEYYTLDVDRDVEAAIESWSHEKLGLAKESPTGDLDKLKEASVEEQAKYLVQNGLDGNDRLGERFRRRIDPKVSAGMISLCFGKYRGEADEVDIRSKLARILDVVNVPFYEEYDKEIGEILQQLFNRIKYVRLEDHGPKLGPIDQENPLIETYFTRLNKSEASDKFKPEDLVLVNNGWVWAGNALVDNAGPQSRVYLRREVIVWGDCVKLRYGNGPQDSPWLWEHMTNYARMLAKYFAGFRIDNCHSTPIHVAEHILDEARRVRPNLYVVAELFTGSEEMDYVFVKRLGLSSLIREAMQAWSTAELSRLVHRHGGRPIGSFEVDEISKGNGLGSAPTSPAPNGYSTREVVRRIKPAPVQALFMDCTHDNEVPAQKRDARDTLPNAALVCMCASATGSVMGYDEIYPKLVDLVNETRLYTSESSSAKEIKVGGGKGGIGGVKKLLNQIHTLMGKDGYDETHIHHEDQYITVHRVHPESRKGYFLIAHTAYPGYGNGNGAFNAVHLSGTKARHLGSWMLEVETNEEAIQETESDKQFLRGLPSRVVDVPGIRLEAKPDETVITVRDKFPPGSIALFETWIPAAEHSTGLDTYVTSGAKDVMAELDLVDLNFLLYRCDAEERDGSDGKDGTYDIPGYGKIVYAGLQGWWSLLKDIIKDNNLAHPLCQNLRDGQWALDYTLGRLERISQQPEFTGLAKPAAWLKERFDAIRSIPNFLLPRYFALVVRTAYTAAFERGLELMNDKVQNGQWFHHSLAMTSVQMTGLIKSASLWPKKLVPSLAAGLPHFAVEWARCWGRDVFISLRGLYLGTGRF
ncbi:glucanotransferase domain of glycogen debranching enzyme-domain-containing protein, partial [Hypoxylon fuscum]